MVTIHFTLRDPSRRVLDTSLGGEPLTYLEGAGQIIDGIEETLRAAVAGEKHRVSVPAAKGYGERDPAQIRRVKRSLLPVEGEVKAGDMFRAGPDAAAPVLTVVEIQGDDVVLDANHPLAGVDLEFEVEIVSAHDASPEELQQAQAAGNDGGR